MSAKLTSQRRISPHEGQEGGSIGPASAAASFGWRNGCASPGEGVDSCRQRSQIGNPGLDATQLECLEILLLKGPEAHGFPTPLWTCPRVARLIRDEFGVRYHEGHVWKILRALRWSPQRPVGKARERNEEAIRDWKCKRWPAIKKKPENKTARSSSSTKAD